MKRRIPASWCTVLASIMLPTAAWSAFVTTNQADMNTILAQPSFGTTPIDVRFQTTVTISNPALLSIDNAAELATLFATPASTPNGINMFFVDAVNFCGISPPLTTILGCADIGRHNMVVESIAASDTTAVNTLNVTVSAGSILNAHELAHNLGLNHTPECTLSTPANLMDCQLMGAELTNPPQMSPTQVSTILASALVQTDQMTGQLYVDITPILIVPLPAAFWLFASALGLTGLLSRRRH